MCRGVAGRNARRGQPEQLREGLAGGDVRGRGTRRRVVQLLRVGSAAVEHQGRDPGGVPEPVDHVGLPVRSQVRAGEQRGVDQYLGRRRAAEGLPDLSGEVVEAGGVRVAAGAADREGRVAAADEYHLARILAGDRSRLQLVRRAAPLLRLEIVRTVEENRIDLRQRLLLRYTGLQAPDHHQEEPPGRAVQASFVLRRIAPRLQVGIVLEWNPEVCGSAALQPKKIGCGDSNHSEGKTFDVDRLT